MGNITKKRLWRFIIEFFLHKNDKILFLSHLIFLFNKNKTLKT